MLLMWIPIKNVSITDIFFTVFIFLLYQAIWSNFMRRILLSMFLKGWSNIFIHKFLKFWCTHQLFFTSICSDNLLQIKIGLYCIWYNLFFKLPNFFCWDDLLQHWLLIFNGIWANVFRLSFRYQFLLRQIKRSEKEEIGVQNVQHSFPSNTAKTPNSFGYCITSYLIWWQNNISIVPMSRKEDVGDRNFFE